MTLTETIAGLWATLDQFYKETSIIAIKGYFELAGEPSVLENIPVQIHPVRSLIMDAYMDAGDQDAADCMRWLNENLKCVFVKKYPECQWIDSSATWISNHEVPAFNWLEDFPVDDPRENEFNTFYFLESPSGAYLWLIEQWRKLTPEKKESLLAGAVNS